MASFSDLVVKLELQQAAFQKGMDQAARQMARVQAGAKGAQSSMSGLEKSMQGVAVAATAVGTAFGTIKGVEAIVNAADRVRQLQGSFTALLGDAGRASDMMSRVFGVVDRTGAPLEAVAGATQRLTIALKELGASNRQIETIAETFIQLGKVGGSSAAETAAGLQQLGQALASGKLGGDELKSIRENAPLVADAIAKGMGVTTGALKQLGEDGKLTADVVANALIAASASAGAAFAKLPQGFEQALNKMEKDATLFAASFDKIGGTTTILTTSIDFIATTLKRWTAELEASNGQLNTTQILVQSVSDIFRLVAIAVVGISFAIEQVAKRTAFWAQQLEALSRLDWDAVHKGSEDFRIQLEAAAAAANATIEALLKGQAIAKQTSASEETGGQPDVKPPGKIKPPPGGGAGGAGKKDSEAEAIRKRGEALAASVDPLNAYNQKLAEYNELLSKGAISDMTFTRAVEQAKAALTSVNDTMQASLDPLVAYGLEMEKLQRLYEQQIITLETFKLATGEAAKKYQEFLDQQKEKAPEETLLEDAVRGTSAAMGEFASDLITGSEAADKAFEKMVKSIITNLGKLLAEFAAAEAAKFIIKSLFGGSAGAGGKVGAAPGGAMLASRPTTWNAAASLAGPVARAGADATAGATTAGVAAGGSPWNVTINNNAPGVDVTTATRSDGGLEVTVERVRSLLAQDVARGGNPFSRSLESAYGLGRGGGGR